MFYLIYLLLDHYNYIHINLSNKYYSFTVIVGLKPPK